MYYFSLASDKKYSKAQFNLGYIYYKGKFVERNINKSIYYFTLAANQNNEDALFKLGKIFMKGKFVSKNINKAIYFFSMADKLNHNQAQFILGMLNVERKNLQKGFYFFEKSANNKNIQANFTLGYFYHEGKIIKRNMNKAIYYYKEASSFNNEFAKNNLAIIYKNGFDNQIEPNSFVAIQYLEEAIQQKFNAVSIYNLANIYAYDKTIKQNIDKSIDLLINSICEFIHSDILLCLFLVKKSDFNLRVIEKILIDKNIDKSKDIYIKKIISRLKLLDKIEFDKVYEFYCNKLFIYNYMTEPILFSDFQNFSNYEDNQNSLESNNINTSEFYEGFGNDIF